MKQHLRANRKGLIAGSLALLAASVTAGILTGLSGAAEAQIYTAEDVFSFRGVTGYQGQALDENNENVLGVFVKEGSEVALNGVQAGDFSWEVATQDIASYQLTLTDGASGEALTYSALVTGSRVAVTVSSGSSTLLTASARGGTRVVYAFSPQSRQVSVTDAQGGVTSCTAEGAEFASWRASLKVTSCTEGTLNIYSLCGYTCVTDTMYDASAFSPALYVNAQTNALAGEAYALPVPHAGIVGGSVKEIGVCVRQNGEVIAEGKYPDGISSVTPAAAGEMQIEYTAAAESGASSSTVLTVRVLDRQNVENTFVPEGSAEDVTVGAGTQIVLPYVVSFSTLNTSADACYPCTVTVTDGAGSPLEGWSGVASERGRSLRLNGAGTYTVTFADRSGCGNTLSYTVTADAELVGMDAVAAQEFYEYGTVCELQPVTLYYKGEERTADVAAYAPDGTQYTSSFTYTMSGIWRIVYSAQFAGQVRSVELQNTVYERADGSFACLTSSAVFTSLGADNAGVLITSSMDERVAFEKTVDLSDARVNTEEYTTQNNVGETFPHIKDKDPAGSYCLIDFNVVNSNAETMDYSRIYIRVTDVHDEENFFEIRIVDGTAAGAGGMSYIRARAFGQSYAGLAVQNGKYGQEGLEQLGVTTDGYNESGGFLMSYGFLQRGSSPSRGNSFAIYYDNVEKALFAVSGTQYCTLIYDFDDPRFSNTPWGGFTTGEVNVSVTLSNISDSASLIVYRIGDYDLSEEYLSDESAPKLTLSEDAYMQAYAIVGKPFRVFEASAADRNYAQVAVQAFFGSSEVPIRNGYFTPTAAGTYTLAYYAVDAFGNRSQSEYVTVQAHSVQTGISLTAQGKESGCLLGREYVLPAYTVTGASGALTQFYGYRKKGASTFLRAEGGTVLFSDAGEYEVLYKVIDHLGQSAEDLYTVTVTETDVPVVQQDFSFYPVMYAGGGYEIYELPATVYSATGAGQAAERVQIMDGEERVAELVPGQTFTPDASLAGKTLTAVYHVEGDGQTYAYTFEVRAVAASSALDKSVYFSWDEGVTYLQENLQAESALGTGARPVFTMEHDGGFAFEKQLLAENFGVTFYLAQGAELFGTAVITLRDSRACAQEVSITLVRAGSGVRATTDGTTWYTCSGAFDAAQGVTVGYRAASGSFTDATGAQLGAPATTTGGAPFTGFSSGRVYFSLRLTDVTGKVSVCVLSVNNQQMSMGDDRAAPELFIAGVYPGYDLGERVQVLPAVADDVLFLAQTPLVSVYMQQGGTNVYLKDENGLTLDGVPADRAYYFTLDAYGTYVLLYTCRDTSSRANLRTERITFIVEDAVPPAATLTGSRIDVAAGSSVQLLSLITLSDNVTAADELRVTVSVRQGRLRTYAAEDGSFTFDKTGRWYVDYVVLDEASNLTVVTLIVDVA